jgi:exonuclease III
MNYGYMYWWDKLLHSQNNGPPTEDQKKWLEVAVPDDRLLLTGEEKQTYDSWQQHKGLPPGFLSARRRTTPTITIEINKTQHSLPTLTSQTMHEPSPLSDTKRHGYPTFRRVTINITSFGPLHDPSKGRLSKVLKLVSKLLRDHDIVYVQETHLTNLHQIETLKTYFTGCHIYGSVSDVTPAQAGVIIIVKNSVTKIYDVSSVYSSDTTYGKGRVVSVKFVPKEEHLLNLFSFRETCIYLKSGSGKGDGEVSSQEERKLVVQELCKLPMDTHISFLGGDINQHTNKALDPYLTANRMEEVEQDINTFYRMTKRKNTDNKEESLITSTRIDRWYCNISAAQAANVTPTSRVLSSITGTVGSYCGGRLKDLLYSPSSYY